MPTNYLKETWRHYKRSSAAVVGLMIVLAFVIMAIFASLIAPYDPIKLGVGGRLEAPSTKHLMGTDDLGRDLYSGIVYGARASLLVGFSSALASAALGLTIGALAGYYGGYIDDLLMRITEIMWMFPAVYLAIVLMFAIGSSVWNVILVITLVSWPTTARLARAEYLSIKEREFVLAAKVLGSSDWRIITGEILPNAITPVIVNTSLIIGSAILLESSISFIGLGDLSMPSWGYVLHNVLPLIRHGWWLPFFPGLAITLVVISVILIGQGLNEALNPRLRKR